jgi:chromosomal replication initiation ATPase DnaA
MYCAKEYYHRTFEKIADWFGGKHHGTVIYAHNNIAKRLKKDAALAHDFHIFIEKLKG